MRPRIQAIVDDIVKDVEPRGHMDLIADFAYRLPVTVICDMLGIPEGDREIFHASSRTGGRLLDLAPLSPTEIQQQNAFNLSMADYFQHLFELRRRQPGDDLTTHLVQAEEAGDKLTNEELTANIILLFGAGHETTVNLIGNGLLALHRNPDQMRLLRDDPSFAPNAVEELLRYDLSVQVTGRTALEDVDEIGGIPLAKGQSVVCLLGSANRDPAVYADPDKLDIRRTEIRPLSFGGGIHYCVGAQLARLEGEIAIKRCCAACPICASTTSSIRIGGRRSSCVASTSCRRAGSRHFGFPFSISASTLPRGDYFAFSIFGQHPTRGDHFFGHTPTLRGTIFIFRSKFLSYRGRDSPGARPIRRPGEE